jgi:hypothetical protein
LASVIGGPSNSFCNAMKHLLLLVVCLCFALPGAAQEPDYHYTFDGNAKDQSANKADGYIGGDHGYGPDREGNANSSIFFREGSMFSYPKLPGTQTSPQRRTPTLAVTSGRCTSNVHR